jgi:hypothetical protein
LHLLIIFSPSLSLCFSSLNAHESDEHKQCNTPLICIKK